MAVKISRLSYNGKELDPARFRIEHLPDYSLPEKDLERIHIDGRDGDVVIDKGSYKNVPRSYNISFGAAGPEDFAAAVSEISKWFRCDGYGELEDSYEREFYRLAIPDGSMTVKSILNGQMGKVELDFSCVPKKYYIRGKTELRLANNNAGATSVTYTRYGLFNPTAYEAKPVVRLIPMALDASAFSGSNKPTMRIKIGEQKIATDPNPERFLEVAVTLDTKAIADAARSAGGVIIDCENEKVYYGSGSSITDMESYTTIKNAAGTVVTIFPTLWEEFENYIGIAGAAQNGYIRPNFWIR